MSATEQTYSVLNIIAFFVQSIKEINQLCKQFKKTEFGEKFVVRVKMMEMLAKQALKHSNEVSYLKETDYRKSADTLYNVYIHLSRACVRNMASQYGSLIVRDYDSMVDALDLIDDRLKTIKVVWAIPSAHCVLARGIKTDAQAVEAAHCVVGECNKPRPNNKNYPVKKSGLNPSAQEWTPKRTLNPLAQEWKPTVPTQNKADNKFARFNHKISTWTQQLTELKMDEEIDKELKLATQCELLCDTFDYITQNEDIIKDQRYHTPTTKTASKLGFVQILINKSDEMTKQINNIYDRLRKGKARSNTELRAIKIEALESIKRTRKMLLRIRRPYSGAVHH